MLKRIVFNHFKTTRYKYCKLYFKKLKLKKFQIILAKHYFVKIQCFETGFIFYQAFNNINVSFWRRVMKWCFLKWSFLQYVTSLCISKRLWSMLYRGSVTTVFQHKNGLKTGFSKTFLKSVYELGYVVNNKLTSNILLNS